MYIKKSVYYKINDDDMMKIYEDFSSYCYRNDLKESYNIFESFYHDNCVEDTLTEVDEEYNDIDGVSAIYTLFREMMKEYNKDFIKIEDLKKKQKELENEYRKIENEIEKIQHQYDL